MKFNSFDIFEHFSDLFVCFVHHVCHLKLVKNVLKSTRICMIVIPGETGLMLFKVTPEKPLVGYKASKEVNDKKLVRNVKKADDVYFNTGDLMMCDEDGYIYFMDRLGDTFRYV